MAEQNQNNTIFVGGINIEKQLIASKTVVFY
jgi:hypothetical protein